MAQKPWGEDAKKLLQKNITPNIILNVSGQDIYQRTLAEVYSSNQTNMGLMMVEKGYARVYSQYHPPKAYKQAMSQAKKHHLGIWGAKGLQRDPKRFRRLAH